MTAPLVADPGDNLQGKLPGEGTLLQVHLYDLPSLRFVLVSCMPASLLVEELARREALGQEEHWPNHESDQNQKSHAA